MKERLILPASILINAVLILIGLMISSNTIRSRSVAATPYIPSSFEVNTEQAPEYMSQWEAAAYLRMDESLIQRLILNGELDGTYLLHNASDAPIYTFSKAKLDEWIMQRIESRESFN